MGIPGILKEIGKGQRVALAKLAIEHLERTKRPLRIAIDAAIWSFQNQASQGGLNPGLRVFYFRLIRLLALPIHPLFVYDGPNKPKVKRNKRVGVWDSAEDRLSKRLLQLFHFPYLTAPGEAEAECAALQNCGIVDAVMSQDADAVMFGSTLTLKNWSSEASKGSHAPTHVDVLSAAEVYERVGLDTDGMVLVALLSGGDYDPSGVAGFGATIACEIAKVKEPNFASDLLKIKNNGDQQALREWQERLNHELHTNESKFFRKRHGNISVPESFPDDTILSYYTRPAVSSHERLKEIQLAISAEWEKEVEFPLNIPLLREFTRENFDWKYKTGARKFVRGLAPSLLSQRLRLRQSMGGLLGFNSILSRGHRFENDGISEVRVQVTPSAFVPVNIDAEEERPSEDMSTECVDDAGEPPDTGDATGDLAMASSQMEVPTTPSRKRKSPPWDPDLPEKYWLPEVIVSLGLPGIVETWASKQEEMRKGSKKPSVKQLKPRVRDANMKPGAMETFFKQSKPGVSTASTTKPNDGIGFTVPTSKRGTQTKQRTATKRQAAVSSQSGRSIAQFFQPQTGSSESPFETSRAFHDSSLARSGSVVKSKANELLIDLRSPTPRKQSRKDPTAASLSEVEEVTSIDIPSSPLAPWSPWVPFEAGPYMQDPARCTTPPLKSGSMSMLSSPISIPSPSEIFASFATAPDLSPTVGREDGPHPSSQVTVRKPKRLPPTRSGGTKSSSPTLKTVFKTTKANEVVKGKVAAIARDSLPGAWKEIGAEDVEDVGQIQRIPNERGERSRAQRVSLVDLTQL